MCRVSVQLVLQPNIILICENTYMYITHIIMYIKRPYFFYNNILQQYCAPIVLQQYFTTIFCSNFFTTIFCFFTPIFLQQYFAFFTTIFCFSTPIFSYILLPTSFSTFQ